MMRFPPVLCVLAFAVTSAQCTATERFQIKGASVGHSSKAACGSSPVQKAPDDKYLDRNPSNPDGIQATNASVCDLSPRTFAGKQLSGTVGLMFVADKLIQLKLDLKPLPWDKAGQVLDALEVSYGKAIRSRPVQPGPEIVFTWTQGPEKLQMSWTVTDSDDRSVEILLEDTEKTTQFWRTFSSNSAINRKALDTRVRHEVQLFSVFSSVQPIKSMTWSICAEIL
jgi:hypothetical protein